eukprot:7296444-Lingulodinium_polyedra.AAC.1
MGVRGGCARSNFREPAQHQPVWLASGQLGHARGGQGDEVAGTVGNYFTRLVLAVGLVVNAKLTIVHGDPDRHDVELRGLLADAFFPKPRPPRKVRGRQSRQQSMEKRAARLVAMREEYMVMWNCNPFGGLIHYCSPRRCACQSREDTVRRFARAFVRSGLAY